MRHLTRVYWAFKLVLVLAVSGFGLSAAWAQGTVPRDDRAWHETISGQIDAFRRGDGDAALRFAGMSFQKQYRNKDGQAFVEDIKRSGYAPIVESFSHSFGDFRRVEGQTVLQVVNFQGPKQGLYQALYQLSIEPDGWRIQSVQLRREPGIGV